MHIQFPYRRRTRLVMPASEQTSVLSTRINSSSLYRQKITHNNTRTIFTFCQQNILITHHRSSKKGESYSHIMYIPPYSKGKAAFRQHPLSCCPCLTILFLLVVAVWVCCVLIIVIVRILQSTGCQDGFLTLIESNSTEFLPVGD
jgi:hypothetical protein